MNEKIFCDPFAKSGEMVNETVMLMEKAGKCWGELLFSPKKIEGVYNSARTVRYREGVDYKIEGRRITVLPGSSMPYLTWEQYNGRDLPAQILQDMQKYNFKIVYSDGPFLFLHQISVDYDYDASENFFAELEALRPENKAELFPAFSKKCKEGGRIQILWYGDSISVGHDSSGFNHIAPFLPPMAEFVRQKIAAVTGAETVLDNQSLAGMTSGWAVENASERLSGKKPDLAVFAWGMNDGTGWVSPTQFQKNILRLTEYLPCSEFLLVGPMLPNADSGFRHCQLDYSDALSALEKVSVGFVDMGKFHQKLLERKKFIDISSNNINHPNDFMIRCYAWRILKTLGMAGD